MTDYFYITFEFQVGLIVLVDNVMVIYSVIENKGWFCCKKGEYHFKFIHGDGVWEKTITVDNELRITHNLF